MARSGPLSTGEQMSYSIAWYGALMTGLVLPLGNWPLVAQLLGSQAWRLSTTAMAALAQSQRDKHCSLRTVSALHGSRPRFKASSCAATRFF